MSMAVSLMYSKLWNRYVLTKNTDYPAYELYTETLRNGIFGGEKGKQLRFVVGKDRKVKEVHQI